MILDVFSNFNDSMILYIGLHYILTYG